MPDETHRSAVDGYLREKWQPRMTQLETQYADTEVARSLYSDFQNDPVDTFLGVANELFEESPEILERITAAFNAQEEAPPAEPPAEAPQYAQLPPEQQAMLEDWQAAKEREEQTQAYATEIGNLKAAHPEDKLITEQLMAPFVVTAQGDFAAAYEGFRAFIDSFQAATGGTEAQAVDALGGLAAPAPPAVLGTTGASGAGAPPPTQTRYASLDDAMDDAVAEMRAAREAPPTVVGSV